MFSLQDKSDGNTIFEKEPSVIDKSLFSKCTPGLPHYSMTPWTEPNPQQ